MRTLRSSALHCGQMPSAQRRAASIWSLYIGPQEKNAAAEHCHPTAASAGRRSRVVNVGRLRTGGGVAGRLEGRLGAVADDERAGGRGADLEIALHVLVAGGVDDGLGRDLDIEHLVAGRLLGDRGP